ncbi:MAG TPA: DUF5615 family PIN-like protein [Candidatus Kapabacteria bacterium]|jgi:uncharacterized protein (DUF433 family)
MMFGSKYPHISSHPKICGGEPCITGTRVSVRNIGAYVQMGVAPEIFVQDYYPWLSKGEVFSALAYFYDHLPEVEPIDIAEQSGPRSRSIILPQLLPDANVPYGLVRALRERGRDSVHVKDIGMRGAPDRDVLNAAIHSNRIILTYNIGNAANLDDSLRKKNMTHPGILVSTERSIPDLVERLESFDFTQINSSVRHL